MSHPIVVKSLADLPRLLPLEERPEETGTSLESPADTGAPSNDLANLVTELEAASVSLTAITRRDQEARASALRDLEQYDALIARREEARDVAQRAHQMRREAEALAETAFTEDALAAAHEVTRLAAQVEIAAQRVADEYHREAARLAARLDLERILAERRRQEEVERARAAEAQRASRLAEALARATAAFGAGQIEDAQATLDSVAKESPDSAEIASLRTRIRQQEIDVKTSVAEETLWAARREYRRDPAGTVARLAAIDTADLPAALARQVFGTWARACARLCRE